LKRKGTTVVMNSESTAPEQQYSSHNNNNNNIDPRSQKLLLPRRRRRRLSSSSSNNNHSDDNNIIPQGLSSSFSKVQQQQQQEQGHKSSKIVASGKSHTTPLRPISSPQKRKKKTRTLVKRAPPATSDNTSPSKYRSPKTPSTSIPKTPLLLLPDSRSVWQAGSYQSVKWSLKYSKSLPKDTTVDIVLVDSKSNRKIASLKRFVPFKKGSAQVWVPVKLPEGASFVLVLELYRGRSQEQVTTSVASSSTHSPYQDTDLSSPNKVSDDVHNIDQSIPSTSTDILSRVVRRSDINISPGKRGDSPDPLYAGSSAKANSVGTFGTSKAGAHHDVNSDDYYTGASTERPFEFLPEEMREEYPNTVLPLELDHTFGLYQKVYSMTPYSLKWKIPSRIQELLDYTRKVQSTANLWNKNAVKNPLAIPKSIFLSKVLVELVAEPSLESVSVLARDIPAEALFQYLSIQEHVPPAFYRLRVQMVVVEVKVDADTLSLGQVPPPIMKAKSLEGWEFPDGGKVIDRYEAITRRFWVSQGAL
ncbi:hypothetical protein BGZ49_002406, partial [Haplosporangium sp. Z 27]